MSCQSVPPVSSHRQAQSSSTYVLGEGRAGRGGEALPPATAIIIALPPPLPSSPSLSHHRAYAGVTVAVGVVASSACYVPGPGFQASYIYLLSP